MEKMYKTVGFFECVSADANVVLATWSDSNKKSFFLYLRLWLFTPGFQLVFLIRLQRLISFIPYVGILFRRVLWYFTSLVYSCDIDPQATIGKGLYIPHATGIVIGGSCTIGSFVTILQNVTIGRKSFFDSRSPVIGSNVYLGAGSCLTGPIEVGDKAVVGSNSVVLINVPSESMAFGVPAVIREK